MTIQTEFLAAGHDIEDELVTCSLPVVIDEVTYYAGYLSELADAQFAGVVSADYGAWTAAAKGGTRYTVTLSGGVAGLSVVPGATDACIHRASGRVLVTTQNQTLYFRYRGYGRCWNWFDGHVSVQYGGVLDSAAGDRVLFRQLMPYGGAFREAHLVLDTAPVGDDLSLRIDNGSGTGTAVTIADGATEASAVFTDRVKCQPGEYLTVTLLEGALNGLPSGLSGMILAG